MHVFVAEQHAHWGSWLGTHYHRTLAEMDMPLRTVKSNIVQSIRAFRVSDLQEAALELGHHFLYANLAQARQVRQRSA